MLPRTVQREISLVQEGKCAVTIIYPHGDTHPHEDAVYARLAERLAESIGRYADDRPNLVRDSEVIPDRQAVLAEQYRRQPLILLGNLNTNRVVPPLYTRYYCATDALYPGGDGYDLRTLVNPYGTGANVLLAGGSSLRGVERAVERLLALIERAGLPGVLKLPYLMEVELEPSLAKMLADWPDAQLDAPPPTTADLPMFRAIGAYAMAFAWTGDARYGFYARDCLRKLNALVGDSYGDRHYYVERLVRAILSLTAGGFLDDADLLRTDRLLFNMLLGQQGMWWRKRDATPPLGHRHHGKGAYEFYLTAQYLRWQACPDGAARDLCDRWIQESRAYLDGLVQAGFDDQDDDTTLNNMATLFWYALGEERYAFFENGNARLAAERAIALHDNMGAAAGQSGYSESYLNMMYIQQEATIPVAAAAFYYRDPHLKWILKKLPNLDIPIAGGRYFYYYPIFMHKFDSGAELPEEHPDNLSGLRVLPLAPYQYTLNNDPPLHIEPAGHLVNAPETWLLPEGVGKNELPREKGFDKIVLRSGYEKEDVYLLMQGYQGGFRWQGRNRAANCIVRFSQFGHIFLIQNTRRLSPYNLNGVYASDGFNREPVPPIAEWLAADDFPRAALSVTRLAPYHHSHWTRHIFWHKTGHGFFVVMDCLSPQGAGERNERSERSEYSFTCTWRTPGFATWDGRSLETDQGRHRFILRSSEELDASLQVENGQSAAAPYVLRQIKSGRYPEGEWITFQNLFYVRPRDVPETLRIEKVSEMQALVTREGGEPAGLCAANPSGADMHVLGLHAAAISAWISPLEILAAGATRLSFGEEPGWEIESDHRLGIDLDLVGAWLTLRPDSPAKEAVQAGIILDGTRLAVAIQPGESWSVALPEAGCRRLADLLTGRLRGLFGQVNPAEKIQPISLAGKFQWKPAWRFEGWTPVPKRLRHLTVEAEPPPIDGFPEQLIDTVYPELRDSRQQWPEASQYQVTLTLAAEEIISHVRVVGDSFLEPFFRLFSPLPNGIQVELSRQPDGEEWNTWPVEPEAGAAFQPRYRGIEDRLEAQTFAIHQKVRRMRLTLPAPAPGRMLALNEIEVYAAETTLPEIKFIVAASLFGSGQKEIVAINENQELLVLAADGSELWRRLLPSPATCLACHDLDGNGQHEICAGLLNGDMLIFSPEGVLRQTIHLAVDIQQRQDAFFGWLDLTSAIQVWQRDAAGRAALMVGGYSMVVFLDPDGKVLGHSYVDGSWVYSLQALPSYGNDIWARTGWNHGIMVYQGRPGFSPSVETVTFGGVQQPMFRAFCKVIPFVNGQSVLFEAYASKLTPPEIIVAAADEGFGVLSIEKRDWLWKIEGGTPITACLTGCLADGLDAVVTGGVDGFIAAYSLYDGQPQRKVYAGGPVRGLAWLPNSCGLLAATAKGLLALDFSWETLAFYPFEAIRMVQTSDQSVVVVGKNGAMESFGFY